MSRLSRGLSRLSAGRVASADPRGPATTSDPHDGLDPAVPSGDAVPTRPPESAGAPDDDRWAGLRSALAGRARRAPRSASAIRSSPLPGERFDTEMGPLRRIVRRFEADAQHAGRRLHDLHQVAPAALARFALDPSLADVDPRSLVFLDTETTGLAGGAGTVPFLVGTVRTVDGGLVLEQWLLERYGEEAPILDVLASHLGPDATLVTYNGKSFDWPLLRARYVLHRMTLPKLRGHLDLVHGARRLFAGHLGSVRARDVEAGWLGHARVGDIDGAEIPEVFFGLARDGGHPELDRVVHHHALDLLGMVAMVVSFGQLFEADAVRAEPAVRRATATVLTRVPRSDVHAGGLAEALLQGDEHASAHRLRARLASRRGDLVASRHALEAELAACADEASRADVLERLAKLLEHRVRDLPAASAAAQALVALTGEAAAGARLARIRRKLDRG